MDLQVAAARYAMGALGSWELPGIADALLDQGIYAPAIGELAMTRYPIMADAGPLFERMLQELHTEIPSLEDAVWILLRHYIGRIAYENVAPRNGLGFVVDVYYWAHLHEKTREYVGDSHGIQNLIGAYWSYDDLEERPAEVSFQGQYGAEAVQALDEEVVRLATEWVDEHKA